MKIRQSQYIDYQWTNSLVHPGFDAEKAQLVLVFGNTALVTDKDLFAHIRQLFPFSHILSCSTSGQILREQVNDDSLVVTAIQFEKTIIRSAVTNIDTHCGSYETGKHLIKELRKETVFSGDAGDPGKQDLCAILVVSDGTHVNGSELVDGMNEGNPSFIPITGGLAGDGARFIQTFVGLDQLPGKGVIAAIGFYGKDLQVGHGSFGGWDEFGPEKVITRSDKNILYEIDGKNALDLYKEYLGPYKDELPGSALLFPLSIRDPETNERLVRTILNINEKEKSMLFAGNLPQGSKVRLMKANFDRLIEGSSHAALDSRNSLGRSARHPDLALLISCVGRKLILQERTDEEVQAAIDIFGSQTPVTGFYSYGEISPFHPNSRCGLHNQTMTITTFSES
ncbi:MAG: FIST C-terminal domain-containing protein [Puia sp.]|nr:FIST C-terminal domain-containing protein [Puia sp.]